MNGREVQGTKDQEEPGNAYSFGVVIHTGKLFYLENYISSKHTIKCKELIFF